jgi:hypothetical protein
VLQPPRLQATNAKPMRRVKEDGRFFDMGGKL